MSITSSMRKRLFGLLISAMFVHSVAADTPAFTPSTLYVTPPRNFTGTRGCRGSAQIAQGVCSVSAPHTGQFWMRSRAWRRACASCFTEPASFCTRCSANRSAERGPMPGSLFSAAINSQIGVGSEGMSKPKFASRRTGMTEPNPAARAAHRRQSWFRPQKKEWPPRPGPPKCGTVTERG